MHQGDRMADEPRRPDAPEAQPELEPYLDALAGLRPRDSDPAPGGRAIDEPIEVPAGPAIDRPDRRPGHPDDAETGGAR